MRHGRKSKRKRIDRYKRHIAVDLDVPGLICGVAVMPANQPERTASEALLADLSRNKLKLSELFIDRGYLGNESIEAARQQGLRVHCKPFPLRNGDRFDKGDFDINLAANTMRCPQGWLCRFAWARARASRRNRAIHALKAWPAPAPSQAVDAASASTPTSPSCLS